MNLDIFYRLTDPFGNPAVGFIVGILVMILAVSGVVILGISRSRQMDDSLKSDLKKRYISWLILAPLMVVPILLGTTATIIAVCMLGLFCHREFARSTGMFRDPITSGSVVLGILMVNFAALDNWYGFFTAAIPLGIALIAAANIFRDRPVGYLQRVALGMFSFGLFGSALGHLAMIANDSNYRAILLWLILCVQMNDVFGYVTGKIFGRRRLLPNTSPGKTLGGALGAIVLTSALAAVLARFVFEGTVLAHPAHALIMGIIISSLGQLGDLVISSVKRDVGIKDMGTLFPGHGGFLDRFDSSILAAPAIFHYIHYFVGIAENQPVRVLTS